MTIEDLYFRSASEIIERIKSQEITSEELTEKIIERIEKINPIINAYCIPTFDLAREMAKEADKAIKKGNKLGLLHGVPTSIKDLTEVKDIRTTFGCKIFENYISTNDEAAAKRLRNSGVIILGKTNAPALGFKPVTDNLIFGVTKNPWNLNKTPGGSSGGAAAATASGLCYLALGSDGGGSIRIPSSLCGVYGFKPSFGRVPQGSMKLFGYMGTLVHIGPIVRYVRDAALMLDAIIGDHPSDRYSLPKQNISYSEKVTEQPKKLKMGFSLDLGFAEAIDSEVKETVLNSFKKFETLDWLVEKARLKLKNAASTIATIWTSGFGFRLGSYLKQWEDKLDPELVEVIKAGIKYSVQEIKSAELEREIIYETISKFFRKYDILLTPTVLCTAFNLGKSYPDEIEGKEISNMGAWIPFTYPFNLTGHPAASIPCGWSKEGLPIGMQIVGRRLDDLTVLQVSQTFEELKPWQDRRPEFN